jgi:hypothetical protein
MTDYELKISSYTGLVAGARHYRGRIQGPYPESCHGGTTFNGWDGPLKGTTTCSEGHVIPKRIEWDVDDFWTEERFNRYAAAHFEGDGAGQFLDQTKLIEVAIRRFKFESEPGWWEEKYPRPEPGDRLFLGHIPMDPDDVDEEWGRIQGTPPWGSLLVQIPAAEEAAA